MDDVSDSDSEGQMIDGMLSSGVKSSYELPSQEELIRRAFAGDDVEEVFEKEKQDILNEENPEPEKPALLPGWGQWTNIQKKKGPPSWMLEQHENARTKREEALKKRKDARLNHVIISEKWDRKVFLNHAFHSLIFKLPQLFSILFHRRFRWWKLVLDIFSLLILASTSILYSMNVFMFCQAEKLHTKTLPYPYTSTEVFEHSIRMPIGPEFNPATAIGALNRPEV